MNEHETESNKTSELLSPKAGAGVPEPGLNRRPDI